MKTKHPRNIRTLYELAFHSGRAAKLINLITIYRIVTAPLLLVLLFTGYTTLFKWLLLVSFMTDAVDGFLARWYKVNSILGAKLDSIGDDMTVTVALVGLVWLYPDFMYEQLVPVVSLFLLFFIHLGYALAKYGKITNFHTYMAKTAGVCQAVFLLSVFFFDHISYPLFWLAIITTAVQLVEEIVLVGLLPEWQNDVKGLYWVLQKKRKRVNRYRTTPKDF